MDEQSQILWSHLRHIRLFQVPHFIYILKLSNVSMQNFKSAVAMETSVSNIYLCSAIQRPIHKRESWIGIHYAVVLIQICGLGKDSRWRYARSDVFLENFWGALHIYLRSLTSWWLNRYMCRLFESKRDIFLPLVCKVDKISFGLLYALEPHT